MLLEDTQAGLIDACRRGEAGAHRALFEQYRDKVYTIALRYAGEPGAAEDIVQDTFLKLYGALDHFRGDASFDAWLYRLVVNACFDQKRKTRHLLPLLDTVVGFLRAAGRTPLEDVLADERTALVRDAIARLDPEHRIVVVFRYSLGLAYEEIAAILECAPGTVASRLHRAHGMLERRLRKHLGKERNNG